jgi:uncharacterized repeat protein (TIGR03803 family)
MKLEILAFAVALTLATNLTAQTFTTLHDFTMSIDGSAPFAGLSLSGNTLFGAAEYGGNSGNGALFKVNTDGSGFTVLHTFTAVNFTGGVYANSDGRFPFAGLILSGNTLYGTASAGGSAGNGTVFAVNTDGSGFTVLHSFTAVDGSYFTNSDGRLLYAGLILSGNTLYGTADAGGSSGSGTVFAINTDGSGFTTLHNFTALSTHDGTNSDGAVPYAGLILSGNTLYGTAESGGSAGNGTVFAVNTDGSDFSVLHNFSAESKYASSAEFVGEFIEFGETS